jgi:hypothetical protein
MLFQETVRYGERFPGMAEHLRAHGTLATGAAQWREGVMQAAFAGRRLGSKNYLEIRYEDLLSRPDRSWNRLAKFLGIPPDGPGREMLRTIIRRNQSPDWNDPAYTDFLDEVEPFIRPTCEFLGYNWVIPERITGAT